MIPGLRTAIYPVPDLEAGRKWYAELLGQAPCFPDGEPGPTGPQPLWGVPNAESAFARLHGRGAVIVRGLLRDTISGEETLLMRFVADPPP